MKRDGIAGTSWIIRLICGVGDRGAQVSNVGWRLLDASAMTNFFHPLVSHLYSGLSRRSRKDSSLTCVCLLPRLQAISRPNCFSLRSTSGVPSVSSNWLRLCETAALAARATHSFVSSSSARSFIHYSITISTPLRTHSLVAAPTSVTHRSTEVTFTADLCSDLPRHTRAVCNHFRFRNPSTECTWSRHLPGAAIPDGDHSVRTPPLKSRLAGSCT